MNKVKCFACQKIGHYASQCPSRKKGKEKTEFVVSREVKEFENEFSLASCLSGIGVRGAWLEDSDGWVMDSDASSHMTRMRSTFRNVSKLDSNYYVSCGVCTMYAVKGVKIMVFHLESGGSLEVVGVMYVLEFKANLLLVSALEDEGYVVMFQDE